MKIWIDLSNSPHPLLFAPIARRFEELGHELIYTARDNAQTVELARCYWPNVEVFGGESPKNRVAKGSKIARRVWNLRSWALKQRPDVALSHNSDSQIAAARLARVPVVTAMDYEHHPANHLSFRLANTILLPQALPTELVKKQGARASKVKYYAGLKEEIYLGDFVPDANILQKLDVDLSPGSVLVVMRVPPSRAIYHRVESSLYLDILHAFAQRTDLHCVVLARHPEQLLELQKLNFANLSIPTKAVDARSLMYSADLFIGAGGTMSREAALLGIPTISTFAGRPAAVDLWLAKQGLLRTVRRLEDLEQVTARAKDPVDLRAFQNKAKALTDYFVKVTVETAEAKGHNNRQAW